MRDLLWFFFYIGVLAGEGVAGKAEAYTTGGGNVVDGVIVGSAILGGAILGVSS